MIDQEFLIELAAVFGGNQTIVDPAELQKYSFDKCPRNLLVQNKENVGIAVVRPKNGDYIVTLPFLTAIAKKYKKKIVVRGGGSGVCGAAVPRLGEDTVIVDMTALDSVEISESGKYVTAGAGILGSVLEEAVKGRGCTLGHSPASLAISTPGGWAATLSSGQFSARYGNIDDLIVAVETVRASGEIRWVTGGGLKDFLGLEGTTGIITKVKMKIFNLNRLRKFRVYSFKNLSEMIGAMKILFIDRFMLEKMGIYLSALRVYDLADQLLVAKPRRAPDRKSRPWKQKAEKLLVSWPKLANGILNLFGPKFLMILVWESDDEKELNKTLAWIDDLAKERKASREADDIGKNWYDNRFALDYEKVVERYQKGFVVDTFDCTTDFDNLANLYKTVKKSASGLAVTAAHFGIDRKRPYIYFTLAAAGGIKTYNKIWQTILLACAASRSFTTHHHGIGFLKSGKENAGAKYCYGQEWLNEAAFAKIHLDPGNRFNPGNIF